MKKYTLTLSFLLFAVFLSAQSQLVASKWNIKPFERKAFIEYKDQLENLLPKQHQKFDYCIDNKSQVLFANDGLLFVIKKYNHKKLGLKALLMSEEKREKLEKEIDVEFQYISVKWLNANPNASIEVSEEQTTNYSYLMRVPNGKNYTESCKGYSKLIYKNIYNGIDIEYVFTEKEGFKYNVIAEAGADLSQIKMQYDSKSTVSLNEKGDVVVKTIKGDLIDHAPITYLTNSKSQQIESSFQLEKNIISFQVNNPDKQAITIDPWTLTPGLGGNPAYDNGVDGSGNVYLYGGIAAAGNVCEKYAVNGTTPLWSLTNGAVGQWSAGFGYYYGDLLVESAGTFYLSEGAVSPGAHTYKFNTNSGVIWTSNADANYNEHWRLALNCITNKVIVSGGGTTSPTDNIAEIDISTGNLTNIKAITGHNDMSGLCVDETGKSYMHSANINNLFFNDASNNLLGQVVSGYNHSELAVGGTPTLYSMDSFGEGIGNGYNMMTLGGASFLFTNDGAILKKWDRNTMALLASVTIPGGSQNMSGGILADNCNNVWVGSNSGVYRYDFNLTQQQLLATSSAVFDIAFSGTGDIMACGNGFATELVTGRITCGSTVAQVVTDPCNPAINSVTVSATGGIAPYTYTWDDAGTGAVRSNLTPGWHIVIIKDANCIPLVIKDSVEVKSSGGIHIESIKPCFGANTGQIKFWLTGGKDLTTFTFGPTATTTQLNDSTVLATGLATGSYSIHVTSVDLPCALDTVITIQSIPLINVSTSQLRKAVCPGQLTGAAKALVSGGQPYLSSTHTDYNFSWNSTPVQTDSIMKNVIQGTYVVTVTDSIGCSGSGTVVIGVGDIPQPAFTSTAVCLGKTTSFTNSSTIASGSITAYGWGFGGTSAAITPTSSLQNPTFTYDNCTALNNATLIAVSDSGCVGFVVNPVVIQCIPVPNFSVSNSCQNNLVQFNSTCSNGNGTTGLLTYNWNLAPTLSSLQNPTNTYTVAGTQSISLVITDSNGCKDSLTKPITIYSLPTANFLADSVCFNSTSHLLDASNGNGNPITSYAWDFTNDNLADVTGPNAINYTMPLVGNNTVNYTVTSTPTVGLSCKTATTINVYTFTNPVASFNFVNKCINAQPNTFDASASNTNVGTIVDYSWNFGDGQTDNSPLPATTNHYNLATLYNVTLTVTTNKGCTNSITQQVEVYEKPLLNITSQPNVCIGSPTTFTAQTLPNSGNVIAWFWDVNNTLNSIETNGQQSSYTFGTEGWQILNLIASTDKGCKDTLTRNVYINYLPKPEFIVDKPKGCPLPHCVTFTDQTPAITGPAQIKNWSWNFGNGASANSATGSNQSTCYTNSSSNQLALFTVTLTTKTDSGCVASNIKPNFITVYPTPIANYTIVPDFGNVVVPLVHFDNQSVDYTKWYWTFGDGPKIDSVNVNPAHTYSTTEANSYHSQLIVVNQYGCKDTAQVLVDIAPDFVFYIPNSFTPNGDNINDGFIGVGIGIEKYEMWIYERWGTNVYYTDDIKKPWTGVMLGKSDEAPQDVYSWKVELKDVFGKKHNYVGHVTLLR